MKSADTQNEDTTEENLADIISPPSDIVIKSDNLFEKYNITMRSDRFIWNDYMPVAGRKLTPEGERASIFSIDFDSINKLPPMDVSVNIITERITIPVLLYDNSNGAFHKNFRPVNDFRLNDGEKYTIKITVKIYEEQQTITFENLRVFKTM